MRGCFVLLPSLFGCAMFSFLHCLFPADRHQLLTAAKFPNNFKNVCQISNRLFFFFFFWFILLINESPLNLFPPGLVSSCYS